MFGDGRQKAFAYWGRYYDPIRNNMTNFAGTLTGSILEEQVWVGALRLLQGGARRRGTRPRPLARHCDIGRKLDNEPPLPV